MPASGENPVIATSVTGLSARSGVVSRLRQAPVQGRNAKHRRGELVSAINAYLAGTARHYAARHNYAAFERSRITIPNPFVIQQFAPGMPENQFDAKTRARALLNNGHNPLRDVIPNVTFG